MKKICYSKAIFFCFLCIPFIIGGCVFDRSGIPYMMILNIPPPDGCRGLEYKHDFEAAYGTEPYTWSYSGELPEGLSLDQETGLLHGTPTADGAYRFTVVVTDDKNDDTREECVIEISRLAITTKELPPFCPGQEYFHHLKACGGTNTLQWSLKTGSLPNGIGWTEYGLIQGPHPNDTSPSTFTFSVTDGVNTDTKEFTLSPADGAKPKIITSPVWRKSTGLSYYFFLRVCGGTPPYTWEETSGLPGNELAPSVSYDSSGLIEGTLCHEGNYVFRMHVEDDSGEQDKRTFLLIVDPSDLRITKPSPNVDQLDSADECEFYSFDFDAMGGSGSCADMYEWSIPEAEKPEGLEIDRDLGTLWGIPSWVPDSHTFTVKVTDSGTGDDDSRVVTLPVTPDTTDDPELVCDRLRHLSAPPYNRLSLTSEEDVKLDFHFDQSSAPALYNLLQQAMTMPPGYVNTFIKGVRLRVSGCCTITSTYFITGPDDINSDLIMEAVAFIDSDNVQNLLEEANIVAGDTATLRLWVDVEYEEDHITHTETYTTRIEDVAIIP